MSIVLEAVAGAALSAFFAVLFDKLNSADLLKIFRQENVDADLRKWKTILLEISEVLDDAEEKQIAKDAVKNWMAELEDLAYDADDILDEFATEALRRKVNAEEPSTSKVRKFIPACCLGLNPSSIMFDANMRSKIKEINTKLQEIVTRKNSLKLEDCARGRTRTITSRVPATSLVESHTYGREEDKKAIVKLLFDESGGAQLSTISILGMGGLGKTTLALLVYNDDKVGSYFKVKAWGCVSQNFDILRVTKEILQDITSETCNDDSLNLVQRKLKEQLSGKKFLLILDDVWIENYSDWTTLSLPFVSGAPGSKILITTRDANVSSTMGATHPYKLRELSNDACLTMFTQHALGTSNFGDHLKVEESQKILERCKGLPLAAKALAGLLRTYNRDEWKDVLNGKIWNLLEKKTDVPSTLRLSYLSLPSSLKKCFAYCSLFPKDYYFKEKELVLLWMAEGLVREIEGEKPMEDLGGDYFHDLLKRSFFQQSNIYKSHFVMHDLMHDLAQWAAGDFCCRLEDQLGGSKQSKISTKVRHFSYIEQPNDCIQKFDDFPKNMHLRTFLSLPVYNPYGSTNFDVKYCLFPQLRCLRVLSLSGNVIFELPSSIGDLKHLRYLNISYTKIKSLPESTSSLYNLQTLILKGCVNLTKLPEKIENLVNLQHLYITDANSIREMPVGIPKLKSLRTLCFKDMDEWQDWIPCRVECGELPYLRKLSISNCPSLKCVSTIVDLAAMLKCLHIKRCPNLTFLSSRDTLPTTLKVLKLVGCPKLESIVDKLNKDTLLEHLLIYSCEKLRCLPGGIHELCHLEEIDIQKCNSLISLGGLLPTNLRSLEIKDCEKLEALPNNIHSLCHLKEIDIQECNSLISLGGLLPTNLRSLKIKDCEKLEALPNNIYSLCHLGEIDIYNCNSLISLGGLLPTSLRSLEIKNCEKLEALPNNIHKLCHLEEIDIQKCNSLISLGGLLPTSLRSLKIKNCEKLEALPNNIHNLCHLEEIDIRKCNSLISLGGLLPTNLRSLEIVDCEKLEALPNNIHNLCHLEEIDIRSCNSLISLGGLLPTNLRRLEIACCEKLEALPNNIHNLCHLEEIDIRRCNSLISLGGLLPTNLRSLGIVNCKKLEALSNIHNLCHLKKIDIRCCNSLISLGGLLPTNLRSLEIKDCEKLEALSNNIHNLCHLGEICIFICESLISLGDLLPTNLRRLEIASCEKLEALPNNIHNLCHLEEIDIRKCNSLISLGGLLPTNLRSLKISGCEKLEALPNNIHNLCHLEEIDIRMCNSLISLGGLLLTNLRRLEIYYCEKLEALPNNIHNLCHLEEINICKCNSLISLGGLLPTNLRRLEIRYCEKLEALSNNIHNLYQLEEIHNLCHLGEIDIHSCDSLISLGGLLPTNLRRLKISYCEKLEALSNNIHNLCHLEEIDICKCNSLISLGGLLPTNLRSLKITYCEKLEALSNNIHNLNFLQHLSIHDCPSIVSFLKKGFPTNLSKLRLSGANLCEQVFELGLHRLTSLTYLEIGNGIMDSFPEEEDGKTMLMLPTSLTTLSIESFPNLLFLSWKFFQNLSALNEISICFCPKLASLSEKCFPPSLQRLYIYGCPVLKQNCEKDKGIMWSKIANIPEVEIH